MIWRNGEPDSDGIIWYRETDCGRYVVSRARVMIHYPDESEEEWRYTAWGPKGTQDVRGIVAMTADAIRRDLGREPDGEIRVMADGREHLGTFRTADEAQEACEEHARMAA